MPLRVFYSDPFVLPLPEGHRFPMEKYVLLRRRVEASGIVPTGEAALPVAVVMSGGYASPMEDTMDIHFATVRMATELASEKS